MQGVVSTLGDVIGQQEAEMEVKVRALMALGMLLAGSESNQRQLAGKPTAVHGLASLMRQMDDEDARQVSTSIFTELVSPQTCPSIHLNTQQPCELANVSKALCVHLHICRACKPSRFVSQALGLHSHIHQAQ